VGCEARGEETGTGGGEMIGDGSSAVGLEELDRRVTGDERGTARGERRDGILGGDGRVEEAHEGCRCSAAVGDDELDAIDGGEHGRGI